MNAALEEAAVLPLPFPTLCCCFMLGLMGECVGDQGLAAWWVYELITPPQGYCIYHNGKWNSFKWRRCVRSYLLKVCVCV